MTTIRDRGLNCSMLASTITGPAWKRHLKTKDEAEKKRADAEKEAPAPKREKTTAERRKEAADVGADLEARRANAQKLIRAGCRVTPGTDSYWAAAPELTRTPKPPEQDHGIGTIMAIEGLVELGMTPSQAIVAATRNGAIAARGLKDFGTIEGGQVRRSGATDRRPAGRHQQSAQGRGRVERRPRRGSRAAAGVARRMNPVLLFGRCHINRFR